LLADWSANDSKMEVEYLDVLDDRGNFTGVFKPRTEVHKYGYWHRVVHVWIINRKGDVVIQKRSNDKETWPGLWDISSAGHVSHPDNSLESAMREMEEELGLKLEKDQLQLAFQTKIESLLKGGTYINKEHIDVYLVQMDVDLSTLVLQQSEVSAVKYIPHKELFEGFRRNDPEFVPCDMTRADSYGILLQDTIHKKLNEGKLSHDHQTN